MADIELVIKIPERDYYLACKYSDALIAAYAHYIKEGKPLPKGHGELIDRDKIEYMKAIHDLKWGKITASECATKIKYSAPTIIPADKAESEDKEWQSVNL